MREGSRQPAIAASDLRDSPRGNGLRLLQAAGTTDLQNAAALADVDDAVGALLDGEGFVAQTGDRRRVHLADDSSLELPAIRAVQTRPQPLAVRVLVAALLLTSKPGLALRIRLQRSEDRFHLGPGEEGARFDDRSAALRFSGDRGRGRAG